MPTLTFREEPHEYLLDGVRLPSVTEILKAEGFINGAWFTDEARTRGTYVHDACLFLDRGTLYEESVDPVIRPYLDAYQLFKQENGFVPELMEKPFHHPAYRYGFKPDRTGTVNWDERKSLWDIKSGQPDPATILQLSAYKEGLRANGYGIHKCYALYLGGNGKYKVEEMKVTRQTTSVFLAALACYQYKQNMRR